MADPVTYPLDYTGRATTNVVTKEPHTLTEINATNYRILVPKFAPFYVNNFKATHVSMTGVETPLEEGVHFNFVLMYLGASRSIGTPVYGGVSIIDSLLDGYIRLDTYQTIGGNWVADTQYIAERLAEIVYNPRTIAWDSITDKQAVFPPVNHDQDMEWVKGHEDLIKSINGIIEAISSNAGEAEAKLKLLLENWKLTPAQVGLENVPNIGLATDEEVSGKQLVEKLVTLRQLVSIGVINSTTQEALQAHIVDKANPHSVNKEQVGLGKVANIGLAQAEDYADRAEIDAYVTLRHLVKYIDKSWVGLDKVANVAPATDAEVASKADSPGLLSLRQALSTFYTKDAVDTKLSDVPTKTEVGNLIDQKIADSPVTPTVAKVSMARMTYLFGR